MLGKCSPIKLYLHPSPAHFALFYLLKYFGIFQSVCAQLDLIVLRGHRVC